MNTSVDNKSINKNARVAGLLYLVIAFLGGFSILYVSSSILVPGEPILTANNLIAGEGLLRLGLVGGLATQTLQIVLVIYLFRMLSPVNNFQAWLMVAFSVVGVPIAMLNLLNHYAGLMLFNGAGYLSVIPLDQLRALGMFFMDLQSVGVSIASIFWGLWLLPLGYLVYKSGFIPRLLGILLIIGGLGYLLDVGVFFLLPNINVEIGQYTFIGELLFPLWLLIKGVD